MASSLNELLQQRERERDLELPVIPDWVRASETEDYHPPILVREAEILQRRKGLER